MKQKRGYIELNTPKAIIKVDKDCVPIEIVREVHGKAQKMIENMMVAANEAVTIYADRNHFPFVYRVHDKPNIDRLTTFAMEAKKLDFKINTNVEDIQSKDVER
jgi:ribonuclease R